MHEKAGSISNTCGMLPIRDDTKKWAQQSRWDGSRVQDLDNPEAHHHDCCQLLHDRVYCRKKYDEVIRVQILLDAQP
jgi:hypothetical protein